MHSVLDDIPGIGPSRRKALMRAFPSIEEISLHDLAEDKVIGYSEGFPFFLNILLVERNFYHLLSVEYVRTLRYFSLFYYNPQLCFLFFDDRPDPDPSKMAMAFAMSISPIRYVW